MTLIELFREVSIPRPSDLVGRTKTWLRENGGWWVGSFVGHLIVLTLVLLVIGPVTSRVKSDAPAFNVDMDTALPEPDLTHFEVGETPLEPSVLTTETLSLVEAPLIDQSEQTNDDSPIFEAAGGGMAANSKVPALGGLGGFDIKAMGVGPAVRGPGGVGSSSGTGTSGLGGLGEGFGGRGEGMRKAMIGGFGGTKQTERAVAAGINWLARHQNADGSWSLGEYSRNCKESRCGGEGKEKSDSAATAFALLPFLAAGQTHEIKGPYQKTIARGLEWLINHQSQDGSLAAGSGQVMYSHGLASIVMCEAFGLSKDRRVGTSAQAAIRFIESGQDPQTGGWWYGYKQRGGDTSVFGWQLMALKSGQMAGLDVSAKTLDGARRWLKSVSKGENGGLFEYRPESGPSATMTSVGLLCSQYLGARRSDPAIVEGLNFFMANMPNPSSRNCYYWYYATQVMHNLPGPEWDRWNREMRRVLLDTCEKEGCAAGSWDPTQPTKDPWADQGGRLMFTSIALLTLEVYYRYLPLYQLDAHDGMASMDTK
jgi:Squalene-hopene cyclase C-terminal domain